eukprot:scaffold9133_cov62-Phaeocystis_antarctica.AAC.3
MCKQPYRKLANRPCSQLCHATTLLLCGRPPNPRLVDTKAHAATKARRGTSHAVVEVCIQLAVEALPLRQLGTQRRKGPRLRPVLSHEAKVDKNVIYHVVALRRLVVHLADVREPRRLKKQAHHRRPDPIASHFDDDDAHLDGAEVNRLKHRQLQPFDVQHHEASAERPAANGDSVGAAATVVHETLVGAKATGTGTQGSRRVFSAATRRARGFPQIERRRPVKEHPLREVGLPLDENAPPPQTALEEPSV